MKTHKDYNACKFVRQENYLTRLAVFGISFAGYKT